MPAFLPAELFPSYCILNPSQRSSPQAVSMVRMLAPLRRGSLQAISQFPVRAGCFRSLPVEPSPNFPRFPVRPRCSPPRFPVRPRCMLAPSQRSPSTLHACCPGSYFQRFLSAHTELPQSFESRLPTELSQAISQGFLFVHASVSLPQRRSKLKENPSVGDGKNQRPHV